MGCWLDVADVQLIELFDIAEDLSQLRAELLFFGRSQAQARQMRHVFHIQIRCSHRF